MISICDAFNDIPADWFFSSYGLDTEFLKGRRLNVDLVSWAIQKKLSLMGCDLSDLHLPEVDFSSMDLGSANFENAYLPGANFEGAELGDANFKNACLPGANFEGAELGDANFTKATLDNAHFTRAKLSSATFTCAILSKADFTEADITATGFEGANLDYAIIKDISAAMCTTFKDASLKFARLINYQFFSTSFENAVLTNAELCPGVEKIDASSCDFRNANLRGAKLDGIVFKTTKFAGANFERAELTNVRFEPDSLLYKGVLEGAKLDIGLVEFAISRGLSLADCRLHNLNLKGLDLSGMNLRGAYLCEVDFSSAVISNVNFSGSKISSVVFPDNFDVDSCDFSDVEILSNSGNLSADPLVAKLKKGYEATFYGGKFGVFMKNARTVKFGVKLVEAPLFEPRYRI